GIGKAKRLWKANEEFWSDKFLPLKQEFIFASTGTKDPNDSPDKYIGALAGSDIQTNPPATNEAIQKMEGKVFTCTIDQFPPQEVLDEIDALVDFGKLEEILMDEGLKKFADPQKALLALIAEKRSVLQATG
ncbi:MAG: transaldolase, partial [Planctomycetes bacterium]|nr:transaldolase [Planctomycetota bacterium]